MIINSEKSELAAVTTTAELMAAATRTAPKTKGIDRLDTLIIQGDDLNALSDRMREIGEEEGLDFFVRDSKNIRNSQAVLLIKAKPQYYQIGKICGYCGSTDCAENAKNGGSCIFTPLDLGIAVGSAVSVAADNRIDNRVMFSAGRASKDVFDELKDDSLVIAIALSANGKNIYFDRK